MHIFLTGCYRPWGAWKDQINSCRGLFYMG